MILRILTLLVAVMLLASPQATACAEVDTQYEALADEACVQVALALPAPRTTYVTLLRHDEPLPPAPALGRVFRPPRTSIV